MGQKSTYAFLKYTDRLWLYRPDLCKSGIKAHNSILADYPLFSGKQREFYCYNSNYVE